MKKHRIIMAGLMLSLGISLTVGAADDVKIIFASATPTPPKIDGVLDEPAWQTTEIHTDFLNLAAPQPRPTTLRLLFDSTNLYLAVECKWNDVGLLKQGIEKIQQKNPGKTGFVSIKEFMNLYGIEVFLDPDASLVNHYQVLANAGDQVCGQFRGDWDPFPVKPMFKARVTEQGWVGEFALPMAAFQHQELRVGDEWGFNLVRNDEQPFVIWKDVGGIFNNPLAFGRLVLGDYQAWWRCRVEEQIRKPFSGISAKIASYSAKSPYPEAMQKELAPLIEQLGSPESFQDRPTFLSSYEKCLPVQRLFYRLQDLCLTITANEAAMKK